MAYRTMPFDNNLAAAGDGLSKVLEAVVYVLGVLLCVFDCGEVAPAGCIPVAPPDHVLKARKYLLLTKR